MPSQAPPQRSVFQVFELVSTLKHAVEMNFPGLWVDGEVSNFVAARSGHWYFSLKDERAQIRCAFFRNRNLRCQPPTNGQRVLLHGQPSIFTGRGELQLIVDQMEDAGAGALHLAFERLKRQLAEEGLFDAARKQPLPEAPRCIGVLSSPQGAAIHDVLTTLARRNPLARVILYPIPVQGADAPARIIEALHTAQRRDECDVLLLTRGGGSLEDLQAFNNEAVARALAASNIPTLSAVGHEIDFSITDFIASERAATPTAAAERLSPDQRHWHQRLNQDRLRLAQVLQQLLLGARRRQRELTARLAPASPQRRLLDRSQWLDDLQQRLQVQMRQRLRAGRQALQAQRAGLSAASLLRRLDQRRQQWQVLDRQLRQVMQRRLSDSARRQEHLRLRLSDLGPQEVLRRGYSITWHDGKVLRDPGLPEGEVLRVQLQAGELQARVSKAE